jgi:hypothetical protein
MGRLKELKERLKQARQPETPTGSLSGATSGTTFTGSLKNYDRFGSLLRTSLISSVPRTAGSSATWVQKATPSGYTYWELKYTEPPMSAGVGGLLPVTTTPTATAILVKDWDPEDYPITPNGRLRKRTKRGVTGSASWAQEMMARMILQRNPNLLPTAETCEEFMGMPSGWTELSAEEIASVSSSRRRRNAASPGKGGLRGLKEGTKGENLCVQDPPSPPDQPPSQIKNGREFMETKQETPVQGAAAGTGPTDPAHDTPISGRKGSHIAQKRSPEYRARKAKQQKEYYWRKRQAQFAVRAAAPV